MRIRSDLNKHELRLKASAAVGELGYERIVALSKNISDRVETLPEYKDARTIATYVARRDEVQTEYVIRSALNSGKRVIVPKVTSKRDMIFSQIHDFTELEKSKFDLLEPKEESLRPVPLDEADVIIVPVVAWDEKGYRLGHGKGYFDIALAKLVRNLTIGLGFEAQKVEQIPEEKYDIPLDIVITEVRTIRISIKGQRH